MKISQTCPLSTYNEPPKIHIFNERSRIIIVDAPTKLIVRTCAVYKYPFEFTGSMIFKEPNNWADIIDVLKKDISKVFKLFP